MSTSAAKPAPRLVFFDRGMLEAKDFWLSSLVRDVDVARLDPDDPRPRPAPPHLSHLSFEIAGTTGERIRKLTGDKPFLLHVLLLAALNVALFRLTGARAAVVGSPATADFSEPNAVAILSTLDPSQSFKSLLQQTRQTLLAAMPHQIYPCAMLLRDLGVEQVDDRCPLFDIALAIEGYHGELPALRHDITLQAVCAGARLSGHISYSSDLFAPSRIERLAQSVRMTLDVALANLETRLYAIDLCTPEERRLLRDWSGAGGASAQAASGGIALHKMVEAQADRRPEATAVICDGVAITFRELDRRASRLARRLQAQGVGSEVVVGLRAGPSIARITGFLAILKAGGAVLPLEPDHPSERIALMIADAGATLVIGGDEADGDGDEGAAPARLSAAVHPEALAYVIYTSGSTGRPKGVGCTHRGLANLAAAQIEAFGVTPTSRVLQFSSFSFDASISEIAMTLGAGATLALAPRDALFPGDRLYDFLSAHAITHVTLVPSVLALLPQKPLPDLKTLIVAGEACPASLVRQWADPDRRFLNAYGPTEITVCASIENCVPGDAPPAIGRPMAGIEIFVLDAHLQPLPPGLAGEIFLGGAGVARGYVNNATTTAEKFVPHPFSLTPGARLYRTGDRGRFRADGALDFLGRRDTQVKLRGFRIELGEIENVLAGHPLVGEAAVLLREDVPGARRLVAYVAPRGSEEPTESGLREHLKGGLPDYLVPEAFVVLAALPKTAKLSVARDRLPAPKAAARDAGGLLQARDTTELGLVSIWERILAKNPIGIRENFFELGGHSFLAVKLLAEIRSAFHCDLPLSMLLQRPTVEDLATAVRERAAGAVPWSAVVPIKAAGSRPPLFCVHPAGGTVLCYADLAAALGPDQAFFGLQEFGLAEGQAPFTRIEPMAALYVQAMKEVQPAGPYRLAGWSFGGLAAYEMAQQLRAGGDEVALLAMFDTYAPAALADELRDLDEVQRLISLFGDDVDLSEDHLRSLDQDGRVHYVTAKAKEVDLLPPGTTVAEVRRLLAMFAANTEAVHAYAPKPYGGTVTLFVAAEKTQAIAAVTSDERTHGWAALARGVAVHEAGGNHHTMLRKPQVLKLGARLRELIEATGAFAGT